MKDYYKLLELNFGATQIEIRNAYRTIAKKYHPDLHFGNKIFEEKFKDINEAYSILIDSEKRKNYDVNYQQKFNKTDTSQGSNSKDSQKNNHYSEQKENHETKHKEDQKAKSHKETNEETSNIKSKKMNDFSKIFNFLYNNKLYRYLTIVFFVILCLCIYNRQSISLYFEEKDRKSRYEDLIFGLDISKNFEDKTIETINARNLSLQTKWKDSLMYYKLSISLVKNTNKIVNTKSLSDINQVKDTLKISSTPLINNVRLFTINFLDEEGFKIHSLEVGLSAMTQTLDSDGSLVGYGINSNTKITPEIYKQFSKWNITYVSYPNY